jgi:hypothetical protein
MADLRLARTLVNCFLQLPSKSGVSNPAAWWRHLVLNRLRIHQTKTTPPIIEMKSITTILSVLALGATVALAADEKPAAPAAPAAKTGKPKPDPATIFKKLDTNNDGKVSADEFKAGPMGKKDPAKADELFGKKDKDGDKNLSLEEFSAHGKKKN